MSGTRVLSFNDRLQFITQACRDGAGEARRDLGIDERVAAEWLRWADRELFQPLVIFQNRQTLETLPPLPRDGSGPEAHELPLVVTAERRARFEGDLYTLSKTGLYRFVVMCRDVRNLIRSSPRDPFPLLEALSLLHVHGTRHNHLSPCELRSEILVSPWIAADCGRIAELAVDVLRGSGFQARKVFLLCLGDWGHDNAHSLIEVFSPVCRRWILVDVDLGNRFRSGRRFLNAIEAWDACRRGRQLTIENWIEKTVDPFVEFPPGFNYSLWLKLRWGSEQNVRQWYTRMFQSVAIREGRRLVCLDPTGSRAGAYYGDTVSTVREPASWANRFYHIHPGRR